MRIALATYRTFQYEELHVLTAPMKIDYCQKRRYVFESVRTETPYGNHTPWDRLAHFVEQFDRYDAVFMCDVDAFPTNFTIGVEDFVAECDEHQKLIFTKDVNGFNNGVFIVLPCQAVRSYFERVADVGRQLFDNHMYREQKAMEHFAETDEFAHLVKWVKPQHKLQGYVDAYNDRANRIVEDERWQPGDFAVHLPGMSYQQRMEWVRRLAPQVVRE